MSERGGNEQDLSQTNKLQSDSKMADSETLGPIPIGRTYCQEKSNQTCERCWSIFACKSKLKYHERMQHNVPCDECGSNFCTMQHGGRCGVAQGCICNSDNKKKKTGMLTKDNDNLKLKIKKLVKEIDEQKRTMLRSIPLVHHGVYEGCICNSDNKMEWWKKPVNAIKENNNLKLKIEEQEKFLEKREKFYKNQVEGYVNKLGPLQRENANLKSKIRELEPEKEHKEITTILGKKVEITYLPGR